MPTRPSPFVHGFKARTQRMALEQRALLQVQSAGPLDPRLLAARLGVRICTPQDVPSLQSEYLAELISGHPEAWSAISVWTAEGMVIIYNPVHEPGRINNSIAHELAHLLLEHERGSLHSIGDCVMREYDERQEKEADWLAGSLLLPEAVLKRVKRLGWDHVTAAEHYVVSEDLFRWRWNASGIDRYLRTA